MAGPELLLIAGAVSGGASIVQGISANQQARQQAGAVEAAGRAERRALNIRNRRALGRSRALIGASGITLSGSPLDVLVDEATTAALGEANVTFNARSRAVALRQQGRNALIGGFGRAGATALTTRIALRGTTPFGIGAPPRTNVPLDLSLPTTGLFTPRSNPIFTGSPFEGTLFT